MIRRPTRVIASSGACACSSVHSTHVHHSDFPEIWAEGNSLVEAATRLARQLERALEGAHTAWHREAIADAATDVRLFIKTLEPASQEIELPLPR